jgi:hypothetical protein
MISELYPLVVLSTLTGLSYTLFYKIDLINYNLYVNLMTAILALTSLFSLAITLAVSIVKSQTTNELMISILLMIMVIYLLLRDPKNRLNKS